MYFIALRNEHTKLYTRIIDWVTCVTEWVFMDRDERESMRTYRNKDVSVKRFLDYEDAVQFCKDNELKNIAIMKSYDIIN